MSICQHCGMAPYYCGCDKPKNKAAQDLGSLGGKAGKGEAKRRSKEHYAKMVRARAEQRKARAEEEK